MKQDVREDHHRGGSEDEHRGGSGVLATIAARSYCLMCRSTKASSAVLRTSMHSTNPTQTITLARAAMSVSSAMPTSITASAETQCIFMLRWVATVREHAVERVARRRRIPAEPSDGLSGLGSLIRALAARRPRRPPPSRGRAVEKARMFRAMRPRSKAFSASLSTGDLVFAVGAPTMDDRDAALASAARPPRCSGPPRPGGLPFGEAVQIDVGLHRVVAAPEVAQDAAVEVHPLLR